MNPAQYLEELQGSTHDMHRDTGRVPPAQTYSWYAAVGLDDAYLNDAFCEDWNQKNAFVSGIETEVFPVNQMSPEMCRHFLSTMYTLKEWPDHG